MEKLNKSDIVFGYRKFGKEVPLMMGYGNWFISNTFALLFGIKLKDTQCGYRAFTNIAYKKIRWQSNDYSMESEMNEDFNSLLINRRSFLIFIFCSEVNENARSNDLFV